MIIDAHHHLWTTIPAWVRRDPSLARLRRRFTMDDLVPELDAAGVDHTVLVEADGEPGETADFLAL
ncbi:MAG: amidohydrolase family protein, partial [Stackebrandtia sp.]